MNLVELDYAAGSIGVDLEGDYPVSRIMMIPLAPTNRVTPEAIRVFTSTTNYANEWMEVTEAEKRYVTQAGVKKLEITFPEGTTARYLKVKTNYDERKKDFTLLNKAEFKNAPESLIRVYYSVTKREELYQYDKLGNRTRLEVRMKGSVVQEYRYYPNSSLLMTDGKWAYAYDKNGNMTKKGDTLSISGVATLVKDIASTYWAGITNPWTGLAFAETGTQWRYSYDLRNRMIEAKKNGATTATYTYTAMGLKVKKERTAATDKTAATIYYAYSLGGRLIYEEEKESGTPTSSYYENVYAYGKNFALEEGTLDATGQPTATGRTYLHTDHLGSVIAATDTAGVTVWTNEYTPFGNSAEEAKRKDKYARFTGKQYDEEAGLYYFNMRWYDSETGRFTSEDPVKDGKAWYAYAANNPMKYVDDWGLEYESAEASIGGNDDSLGGGNGKSGSTDPAATSDGANDGKSPSEETVSSKDTKTADASKDTTVAGNKASDLNNNVPNYNSPVPEVASNMPNSPSNNTGKTESPATYESTMAPSPGLGLEDAKALESTISPDQDKEYQQEKMERQEFWGNTLMTLGFIGTFTALSPLGIAVMGAGAMMSTYADRGEEFGAIDAIGFVGNVMGSGMSALADAFGSMRSNDR